MPELMFVLKAFVLAIVVTIGLQMRIGASNTTVETEAHTWMQTSSIPNYLRDVSSGAILAVRNASKVGSDFVAKTFGHDGGSQRAGRLNLDFKRSAPSREIKSSSASSDESK